MDKSTKKAQPNNFGPAATEMKANEEEIEVGFGIIMTGENVEKDKFEITDLKSHTCVIDGDKAYRIDENGEIIKGKAEIEKFDKIKKQREAQGRKVKHVAKDREDDIK